MPAKRKRPPKAVSTEEMAAILAYSDIHGAKAASVKFSISERTIHRRRAEIRSGEAVGLAALVMQTKGEAAARCGDLLTDVLEDSLRHLQELMPTADVDQTISAVQMLGELDIAKKAIIGDSDEENHGVHRPRSANASRGSSAPATTH